MSDSIVERDGIKVQQGPLNDRVYLLDVAPGTDCSDLAVRLKSFADEFGREKVIARVPEKMRKQFMENGYRAEARARKMYGKEDGVFFIHRRTDDFSALPDDELSVLHSSLSLMKAADDVDSSSVTELGPDDAPAVSELLGGVFSGYPFPVEDPGFISESMSSGNRYFGIRVNGELASVGTAEVHPHNRCAEMTDMATREEHRGKGMARAILSKMESEMRKDGYRTVYTIAKAESPGINHLFSSAGYHYGGTLRSSTYMDGRIRNMNVWHKNF